jgi:hypothetical protein
MLFGTPAFNIYSVSVRLRAPRVLIKKLNATPKHKKISAAAPTPITKLLDVGLPVELAALTKLIADSK